MKKIAFVVYREWAYKIFLNNFEFQKQNPEFIVQALITTKDAEFALNFPENFPKVYCVEGKDNERIADILAENDIDIVCYYGWSWFVTEPILSTYICLCLHPSRLPEYRGGSPIQHQIIDGVLDSAVTVFRLSGGVDDGDIYAQRPLSLKGTLVEIFDRMQASGTSITQQFITDSINDTVIFNKQFNLDKYPPRKRRTLGQSELSIENIEQLSYVELYNYVRALADPYPNACIIFPNQKLLLHEIEKVKEVPGGGCVLRANQKEIEGTNEVLYLKLTEGYAAINKYSVVLSTQDI